MGLGLGIKVSVGLGLGIRVSVGLGLGIRVQVGLGLGGFTCRRLSGVTVWISRWIDLELGRGHARRGG